MIYSFFILRSDTYLSTFFPHQTAHCKGSRLEQWPCWSELHPWKKTKVVVLLSIVWLLFRKNKGLPVVCREQFFRFDSLFLRENEMRKWTQNNKEKRITLALCTNHVRLPRHSIRLSNQASSEHTKTRHQSDVPLWFRAKERNEKNLSIHPDWDSHGTDDTLCALPDGAVPWM